MSRPSLPTTIPLELEAEANTRSKARAEDRPLPAHPLSKRAGTLGTPEQQHASEARFRYVTNPPRGEAEPETARATFIAARPPASMERPSHVRAETAANGPDRPLGPPRIERTERTQWGLETDRLHWSCVIQAGSVPAHGADGQPVRGACEWLEAPADLPRRRFG